MEDGNIIWQVQMVVLVQLDDDLVFNMNYTRFCANIAFQRNTKRLLINLKLNFSFATIVLYLKFIVHEIKINHPKKKKTRIFSLVVNLNLKGGRKKRLRWHYYFSLSVAYFTLHISKYTDNIDKMYV